MKSSWIDNLQEVCENKGYKIMDNPLSDNPNSIQIVRINEKWDNGNYGVLQPIQLEVFESWNWNEEMYVYRDMRYPKEHQLWGELSDYQTLDEIKDVILNGGMGITYGRGKFEEVISLEDYENSEWYIDKYNLNEEIV